VFVDFADAAQYTRFPARKAGYACTRGKRFFTSRRMIVPTYSLAPHRVITVVALLAATAVCRLDAQMPGLPVLQNGFSNPGITAAVNYGTAEGVRGYGLAGAWAPASGRFQVSGGIGGYDPDEGKTWLSYGGRIGVPLTMFTGNGSFGVAPFAGIGAASREGMTLMHVPLGIAGGYRRAVGETRAVSVYGSSFYGWNRFTSDVEGVDAESNGVLRFSGGLDFALTPSLGVTAGYEFGAKADAGEPGPTGSVFGIGLSYAFRR
jgi:hypothetical protein